MGFLNLLELYIPQVIFGCVALSLVLYVVLDGFDLGVGILSLAEPDGAKREEMMETIATVWDGNESWLVLLGAVLFAGFPLAFGLILPALYIPLVLMILSLAFRGVAFEFQAQHGEHSRLWGYSFALGSLGAAFTQGVSLGAFLEGFAYSNGRFIGGTLDFLTPLSVATGFLAVALYTLSGAGWLVYKTRGGLLASARSRGRFAALAGGALFAASLGLALTESPAAGNLLSEGLGVRAALVAGGFGVALAALAGAYRALGGREGLLPLGLASLAVAGVLGGFGAMVYPHVVLPGITLKEAAAPASSAWLLLAAVVPLIPVTLAYNGVAYWLFRGKTQSGHHKESTTGG